MVGTLKGNNARSKGPNPQPAASSSNWAYTAQKELDPWTKQKQGSQQSFSESDEMEIASSGSSYANSSASSITTPSITSTEDDKYTAPDSRTEAPQPIPSTTLTPTTTELFDWTGPLTGQQREALIIALQKSSHSMAMLTREKYPLKTGGLYQASPARRSNGPPKCLAVALDCEMALTEEGPECVQLCAVDLVTGERIIDIGVIPIPRVWNWQTRWSGMSWPIMKQLRAQGRTVQRWQAARGWLFSFIDEDTVLVGQSMDNDLRSLKIVHRNVVDTALVTKMAVEEQLRGECGRKWALKRLAAEVLGIPIQQGRKGHSCMEDMLATREVLLKFLLKPDELEKWAKEAAAKEQARVGSNINYDNYDTYDDAEGFL